MVNNLARMVAQAQRQRNNWLKKYEQNLTRGAALGRQANNIGFVPRTKRTPPSVRYSPNSHFLGPNWLLTKAKRVRRVKARSPKGRSVRRTPRWLRGIRRRRN